VNRHFLFKPDLST